MGVIKSYADWEGDLSDYLKIGDLVDEAMVEYFINVLPPATMNGGCIQIGEACEHIGNRATYSTLKKTPEGWSYAGHCFRGQTEEPK